MITMHKHALEGQTHEPKKCGRMHRGMTKGVITQPL